MGLSDFLKRLLSPGSRHRTARPRPHPPAKRALSAAAVADHVRIHHTALCSTFLELLVPGSPDLRDLEITDQFLIHLAEKTYLIQLGYVYLAVKNQLGTLPCCQALILRVHQHNVEEASRSLRAIQNGSGTDREQHMAGIFPSARMGLSQDEVAKLARFCAAVAIFGFDDAFLDGMSAPLRALTEYSEATAAEDRRMAFRLAVLSFHMAFDEQAEKADKGKWAALINAYSLPWLAAWDYVLAQHTEFLWDVPITDL